MMKLPEVQLSKLYHHLTFKVIQQKVQYQLLKVLWVVAILIFDKV